MKTETLERPSLVMPTNREVGKIAITSVSSEKETPQGIVHSAVPGPEVYLPSNYLRGGDFAVPSTEIRTFRGHDALVVPLFATDSQLNQLYLAASRGRQARVDRMTLEMAVRILDTTGAEGLHHMHGTQLPRTVFYNAKPGGLQVYMTSIGDVEADRPVLAVVGATGSPRDELKLLNAIGGRRLKGRG
ncbi:MAG TPA: hypothetical protein VGS28_01120 [Candidatus Saccharimonadales bacterium]|nr:hypothetical protein [Candidatus Saccharimonadales bacterium]